jgi:hypothetical protein
VFGTQRKDKTTFIGIHGDKQNKDSSNVVIVSVQNKDSSNSSFRKMVEVMLNCRLKYGGPGHR